MEKHLDNASKLFNSSLGIAFSFGISGLLSMMTRILLARILEPSGYGVLSEALAILTFFVTFVTLGTSGGVARFIAHDSGDEKSLSSALAVVIPISLVSAAVLYLFSQPLASLMGSEGLKTTLEIFALNIPAVSILSLFTAGFRGRKRTLEPKGIEDVVMPLTILVGSVTLAKVSAVPHYAAVGYTLAGWIGVFLGGSIYLRRYSISLPSISSIRKLTGFSLPLMVRNFFELGTTWANILLLGYFMESSAAGIYNTALPISYGITFGLNSISYLAMPLMSSLHGENRREEMESLYETMGRWLVVTALPVFLVVVLKPDLLVDSLFGSSYSSAAAILVVLSIGRFIDVGFGPLGQMLVAAGENRWEAISKMTGFLIVVGGSVALIPIYGLSGAAFSYSLGLTIENLLRLWRMRRHGDFNPASIEYSKPVLAAALASIALLTLRGELITELAGISLFFLVYGVTLLGSRPLKEEDIHSIELALEALKLEKTDKTVGWLRKFQE